MSHFSYYAGTVPTNADTTWSLWAKIVIRLSQLTGNQSHLPTGVDTKRQLMVKAVILFKLL